MGGHYLSRAPLEPISDTQNLVFPVHVYRVLEAEAADLGLNKNAFLRRLLRWDSGLAPGRPRGMGRHTFGSPTLGYGKKQRLRVPREQRKYLQALMESAGLTPARVLVVLLYRWLGVDPQTLVAPAKNWSAS